MSVTFRHNCLKMSHLGSRIRTSCLTSALKQSILEKCKVTSNSCTYSKYSCLHYGSVKNNNYERCLSLQYRYLSNSKNSESNDGTSPITKPENVEVKEKLTLYQRFKRMYKEYWYVLVPVHIATSIVWFGGFYYLAVSGVDVVQLLEVIGTPQTWLDPLKNSKAGGLVSAYTMYKIATPARYTVTVGGTTVSINYLKKWGWIKPIPNTEKLKEMYQERKDAFMDMKDVYQDKIKDELKKTVEETKDEIKKTKDQIKQGYLEAKEGFQRSSYETKVGFKEGITYSKHEWGHVIKLFKTAFVNKVKDIAKKK